MGTASRQIHFPRPQSFARENPNTSLISYPHPFHNPTVLAEKPKKKTNSLSLSLSLRVYPWLLRSHQGEEPKPTDHLDSPRSTTLSVTNAGPATPLTSSSSATAATAASTSSVSARSSPASPRAPGSAPLAPSHLPTPASPNVYILTSRNLSQLLSHSNNLIDLLYFSLQSSR